MSVTPTTVAGRFAAILGVFTWGGLTTRLLAEPARWVLWLPVALGGGIALFFALPKDPPNGAGWLALTVAALVALAGRRSPPILVAALAVAVASGGFTIVQHRAAAQAAPILERRLSASEVTARVVEVARLPQGLRLALEEVRIEGLAEAKTPKRVRVTARKEIDFVPRPGDIVSVRALLQPPPAPSMPGAYDFAREAYFQRLGAVGSAHGPLRLIEETNARPGGLRLVLENLRETMTRRIFAALPEGQAAIAAALITGDQLAIPKESLAAWRDSGLAHMLSISGLHFALVVGFVFAILRTGIALVPWLALRVDGKRIAAVIALAASAFYLAISGAGVPTQRSFIMVAVVMIGILLGRQAISMRLVAVAAMVLLLWSPEAVLGASFQMSFAAVIALIAVYEGPISALLRRIGGAEEGQWWRRPSVYILGTLVSTFVAGLATAPFALYHFDRYSTFGPVANLLSMPLCALAMGAAVFAVLAMPLGWERWPLLVMDVGIEGIDRVAREIATWPHAAVVLEAMPLGGIVAVALGGLWLCLWQGGWRWWGALPLLAGAFSFLATVPPDVLVDGRSELMAVRSASGGYLLSGRPGITGETWLRRAGREAAEGPWPRRGASLDGRLRCDVEGCLYRAEGRVVALAFKAAALEEGCRSADVVVSREPTRGRCASAKVVIDRFDTWRRGPHAVWITGERIRVETVAAWRGDRPWSRAPVPRNRREEGG